MTNASVVRRATELLFFFGALVVLVWLVRRVGFTEVTGAISSLGWIGFAVVLGLGLSETLADALSLHATLSKSLSRWSVLTTHAAGSFVNIIAPWDLGEVAKTALLSDAASATERIGGVVIWNYAFKLTRPIVSFSAAALGALFATGFDDQLVAVVVSANVLAFVPYLVIRLLLRRGFATWLSGILESTRLLGRRAPSLAAAAREIDATVRHFAKQEPRAWSLVLWGQIAGRLASLLSLMASLRYLGFDLTVASMLLLYAGLNVAEFVLSAVPARVGVGETAAYGLFAAYGLDPAGGLVTYLVMRLRTIVVTGVLAAFALLARGRGDPRVIREAP